MHELVLDGIASRLETIMEQGNATLDEMTQLKRDIADLRLQMSQMRELIEAVSKDVQQRTSYIFPPVETKPQPWFDQPFKLPGISDWSPPPPIWSGPGDIKIT